MRKTMVRRCPQLPAIGSANQPETPSTIPLRRPHVGSGIASPVAVNVPPLMVRSAGTRILSTISWLRTLGKSETNRMSIIRASAGTAMCQKGNEYLMRRKMSFRFSTQLTQTPDQRGSGCPHFSHLFLFFPSPCGRCCFSCSASGFASLISVSNSGVANSNFGE